MRRLLPILALLAGRAAADETLAVLAVADPPGPEPELAELTHQLRAACRERAAGVQEVPEMRQRLLGQWSTATLAELERAYGGALATYQNGESESSIRTLYAIIDDLERLPESPEAWSQWVRAQLRLAHVEGTVGHVKEAREAMERVLALEPRHQPDPDLYSPTYRREFEAVRSRLGGKPRRRIAVDALGWSAAVFVNGKSVGTAPIAVSLPPGRYRVGGRAGTLRVPSVWVDLGDENRAVALDFGLAEALRVAAGPGLALPPAQRQAGAVRAGAWLGADRLLVTSIAVENDVPFLVGSLFDVRRAALQREGRVRMAAGSVPSPNMAALAAFLLTGQQSKAVLVARAAPSPVPLPPPPVLRQPGGAKAPPPASTQAPTPSAGPSPPPGGGGGERAARDPPATPSTPTSLPPRLPSSPGGKEGDRSAAPVGPVLPPAEPGRSWMRPAAWASAALAAGLAGVATWQGFAYRAGVRDANAMLRPDGSLQPGVAPADYDRARASADASRRNAYAAAAGTVAFAAAAGILGWLSRDASGAPVVRF